MELTLQWKFVSVIGIIIINCMTESLCQMDNSCANGQCGGNGRILSRKKRMLTFPEGSSLQLGMCIKV